jgi:5S rRNA maturation endonuclease (ribonuclease M5)
MLNTKNVFIFKNLTDKILNLITPEEIFRKYIPFHFEIGKVYISPLRDDDTIPSFGIYYNQHYNKLMYKDYRGNQGDCFIFVKEMFNISYTQALKKICYDFKLDNIKYTENLKKDLKIKIKTSNIKYNSKINYQIKSKNFTKFDLDYWESYGINLEILKFFNVYRVEKIYKNKYLHKVIFDNNPTYCYYFPRTSNIKLYSPFEKKENKWRNTANNEWDIQGYDQLPEKGDLIIITKSMKDVMTLYSLGYTAVATHAESERINPDFIRHIKKRFENVIIFFDNDIAGKTNSLKLSETFNLLKIEFDEFLGVKDISDCYKEYNKESTLMMLQTMITYEQNKKTN